MLRWSVPYALALGLLPMLSCEYQPSTPPAPPPRRGLPPSQQPARPPRADPFVRPPAKRYEDPRAPLEPNARLGGGAIARLTKTQQTPVFAAAPGRDLRAELDARVASAGLETCLARAATRTEGSWRIDWATPEVQPRETVERVQREREPARTVRVRVTFTPAGRVSNASVSVSPSVPSAAQQCMQSRIEGISLSPLRSVQTLETSVGLAPSG